jgi:hypothetical protein
MLAYQDAALSHTANGIYGEMWAAALIAASFAVPTARDALDIAMTTTPAASRLAEALRAVHTAFDCGLSWRSVLLPDVPVKLAGDGNGASTRRWSALALSMRQRGEAPLVG